MNYMYNTFVFVKHTNINTLRLHKEPPRDLKKSVRLFNVYSHKTCVGI